MSNEGKIPESTLELLARSIYRQSNEYGFKRADYLRLINHILDTTMAVDIDTNDNQKSVEMIDYSSVEQLLPLLGNQVKIRKYESLTDLTFVKGWVDDRLGRYFLLSCLSNKSPDIEDMLADESNHIGIITSLDDIPIGIIAYLDFNCYQRKAELRKMIGDINYRGKGLAREATQLWVNYGFSTLKLHKIYLNTLHSNLRNIKLNEELGFKVEGILRNEVYFDGVYHDVLRMGLVV